jgi:hypothetical protein
VSRGAEELRRRREALLTRGELQRLRLKAHREQFEDGLQGVDRILGEVRRRATPRVLAAVGVGAALLVGTGRARRVLAGGLTLLGLALRIRSGRELLARWSAAQPVRRSR